MGLAGHLFRPAAAVGDGGFRIVRQHPGSQGGHFPGIYIAYHAQQHVTGAVECSVALGQYLRSDPGDGFSGTQDRLDDGVVFIHGLHQQLKTPGVRVVGIHVDLLADDTLLLFHTLRGEIGGGDKFQQ